VLFLPPRSFEFEGYWLVYLLIPGVCNSRICSFVPLVPTVPPKIGGSISDLIRYNLPGDYFALYPSRVRALSVGDLTDAAKKVVRPEGLTWVIVGDRAKIEAGIKELNYGELQYIDSDGTLVK